MKKIYYVISELASEIGGISPVSPFLRSDVGYDLNPISDYVNEKYIFTRCPVWKHKANRTYVVRSPVDFSFKITKNGSEFLGDPKQELGENFIYVEDGWDNGKPVLQLGIPIFLSWTKEKNVWIDVTPSPYTSRNNNFVALGGQWNLSNWTRTVSFAIEVCDRNEPVIVKRGDPLYYVTFRGKDPNEAFKLVRSETIPDEVRINAWQRTSLKKYIPGFATKFLFAKQESKCPFKFMRR